MMATSVEFCASHKKHRNFGCAQMRIGGWFNLHLVLRPDAHESHVFITTILSVVAYYCCGLYRPSSS